MRAVYIQYALGFIFLGLGGWTMFYPDVVGQCS
jgi:hypothetical protein